MNRPAPPLVVPGATPGAAPSDAIVLFDGKDLSKWAQRGANGESIEPKWPVRDGYFETGAKSGSMFTRDSFGDVQLHIEWATPSVVSGTSQGRGNSGVILMGRYEVQVLDMYNNRTYADGGAGSLYGQWPPLVSAPRPPGEWQTYDIIFEAPRFEGDKLVKPAFATVFWNGVLAQHRKELVGSTVAPHRAEVHAAPGRTAADAAGSLESGAVPECVDQEAEAVAERQIPSSKLQIPRHSQLPTANGLNSVNRNCLGSWSSGVRWDLELGAWDLFLDPLPQPLPTPAPASRG